MVEAIYAKVDLRFNDTRSARNHSKEEAKSKNRKMGRSIFVTERGNPSATFGGVVDAVTNIGRVIALIDIFGRLTPVESEPKQLTPAA
jgi:transcriptional antiterminator NusG